MSCIAMSEQGVTMVIEPKYLALGVGVCTLSLMQFHVAETAFALTLPECVTSTEKTCSDGEGGTETGFIIEAGAKCGSKFEIEYQVSGPKTKSAILTLSLRPGQKIKLCDGYAGKVSTLLRVCIKKCAK